MLKLLQRRKRKNWLNDYFHARQVVYSIQNFQQAHGGFAYIVAFKDKWKDVKSLNKITYISYEKLYDMMRDKLQSL